MNEPPANAHNRRLTGSFTPQSMREISIDAGFVENIEALTFNGITSSIGLRVDRPRHIT